MVLGIKKQTRMTLENLKGILNEVGSDLSDVIKGTVFYGRN